MPARRHALLRDVVLYASERAEELPRLLFSRLRYMRDYASRVLSPLQARVCRRYIREMLRAKQRDFPSCLKIRERVMRGASHDTLCHGERYALRGCQRRMLLR